MRDASAQRRGQRQRAPLLGFAVDAIGTHEQACQALRLAIAVEVVARLAVCAIAADEILQAATDGRLNVRIRIIQ